MTKLRFILAIIVLTLISVGLLQAIGCGDTHPDVLIGTWKETNLNQGIVLEETGDFKYIDIDQQLNTFTSGTGKWSVSGSRLIIELESGHMKWFTHTVTSQSTLTWTYEISGNTITLTEAFGDESVTYNKV